MSTRGSEQGAIDFHVAIPHHAPVSIITLLTDFGTRDWFVPSMKGVILSIAPGVRLVDMTHEIPPQDVRAGAFVLASAARCFPKGTIHVAVVDPGVGSERRAVAVKTRQRLFIGPDNGLLSLALRNEEVVGIRSLDNERLFRRPVSHTFHGRDIFAPVAAHLANGTAFSSLGVRLASLRQLDVKPVRSRGQRVEGEVVFIDRYGNLITNIPRRSIRPDSVVLMGKHRLPRVVSSYASVEEGRLVAVINSLDLLEISARNDSAAVTLGARVGTKVSVRVGASER